MPPPVEISIPSTSLVPATGSDKPFTLYNITLRLPLRSYVFQKRYSEFAALHRTLTDYVGEAPPVQLPAKSWFRSTVDSPVLTENRRTGLEAYLRAIAESPDRRWRDTSAWRAFLNLPGGGGGGSSISSSSFAVASKKGSGEADESGSAIESRLPAIGLSAANAAAATDPVTWLDLHKEMKKALHDARLQLARRDAATDGGGGSSSAAVAAGAAAKRELVKVGSLLAALTSGLQAMSGAPSGGGLGSTKVVTTTAAASSGQIMGEGELRRRRDLLAAARVEKQGLEALSASLASGGSSRPGAAGDVGERGGRAALFAGVNKTPAVRTSGRVLGAPLPETAMTRELDNAGVLDLQKQMMAEQDQEVETLARIVQRQKELGLAVQAEVEAQMDMLTQLDEDTERVGNKIRVAKDRTKRLG